MNPESHSPFLKLEPFIPLYEDARTKYVSCKNCGATFILYYHRARDWFYTDAGALAIGTIIHKPDTPNCHDWIL